MEIIRGADIAAEIKEKVRGYNQQEGLKPVLAVIIVGDDKQSLIYVGLKEKAVASTGGKALLISMPAAASHTEIIKEIKRLNQDDTVDGILVQLPLPENLSEYTEEILMSIDPQKDVDGFTPCNRGLLTGTQKPYFISCAAIAAFEVAERYVKPLAGRKAVLVGDSFDLIIPLSLILIKQGCRVNVVPEYKPALLGNADIYVLEKGEPGGVKGTMVKEGALIIDSGFHWDYQKICGNVNRDSMENVNGFLLPVPAGLGPILIAKLAANLSEAAGRRKNGRIHNRQSAE